MIEEMTEWCSRLLLPVDAAIFVDAIHVKVRDGQVSSRRSTPRSVSTYRAGGTCSGYGPALLVTANRRGSG